jgi:hypothetical protein
MRIFTMMLLTMSWTLVARAQSPDQQGGASQKTETPPPASLPAPQSADSQPPATLKFPMGTMVYLHIVEPAKKGEFTDLQFRNSSVGLYDKLTKEFERERHFVVVEHLQDAQLVFFVLRYWKPNYPHALTYLALAVRPEDYKQHVQMLNPYRGAADVDAMLLSAIWGTGKNYNMAKHWTLGLATAGVFNAGRPNPVDLVKQFEHDTQ